LKVFIVDRGARKETMCVSNSDSMRLLSSPTKVFVSVETLVGHP
jgi:hypothetical protein